MPRSAKKEPLDPEPRARLRRIEERMKKLPLKSRLYLRADIEELRRVADLFARREEAS